MKDETVDDISKGENFSSRAPFLIDVVQVSQILRSVHVPLHMTSIFVSSTILVFVSFIVLGLSFAIAQDGSGGGEGLFETFVQSRLYVYSLIALFPFLFFHIRIMRATLAFVFFFAFLLFLIALATSSIFLLNQRFAAVSELYILALIILAAYCAIIANYTVAIVRSLSLKGAEASRLLKANRPGLRVLAIPRWFFRMGPRSLFVIPVFVVANFTFLIAFSWLFAQILTLPSDMMTVALQSMSERPPEESEAYRHGEASAGLLGALFVSAAAGWILRRAKRLGIQTGPEVKARDSRSPILFLRSFRDEQVSLKAPGKVALTRFLSQEATPETLDELLAMEGAHHGPVVAIGDPALHTLRVGAARTFVGDENWKSVVLDEMKAAQAIVVVVEDTAGSVWEVETIFGDAALLRKTCFLKSPRPDAPGFPDVADHCRDPFSKAVWGSVSKLFREGRLFGLGIGRAGLVAAYAGTASDALDYQVLFRDYFSRVIDEEL